jgi:hypothetical protein
VQTAERMNTARPTTTPPLQPAIAAMAVGLVLTIAATIVPFVTGALRDHIRTGYPTYTDARVDSAVNTWLIILTVIGALGIAGWLGSIWIVARRKPWATWAATGMFALGTCVAVADLVIKDKSGDVGLAPLLGWIGMLPSSAGLIAVVMLWRRSPTYRHPRNTENEEGL